MANVLIGFLEGIAQIEVQFPVARYRIDFYLPEYCFAIEYDENHHGHPNQLESDSTREIEIRTYIPNIEFIRVREGSEIGGINRVIRKILSKKYNAVLLRKPT